MNPCPATALPAAQGSVPDLSIVIVSFNTRAVLQECLERLAPEIDGIATEIIVVDNASRDGSAEMVESRFPQACLILSSVNL